MFSLNYKTVGFFIQKLLSLITMMKFHINLFCGVYLLVHLIKETKNLELKQQSQFLILVWFWTMGRHIGRNFICSLVKNYYIQKQNHHKLCHCYNCKYLDSLLSEMERWNFYQLNRFHSKWFITFHQKFECQITLFPVFI